MSKQQHEPSRKSILEAERSRKMVELILNKGCKPDLSGVCLARLDLSSLHMPSINLVGSDLRSAHLPKDSVITSNANKYAIVLAGLCYIARDCNVITTQP